MAESPKPAFEVLTRFDQHVLDRMVRSHEIVRERLLTVTLILDRSRIDYAVIGGNAVAYWVATEDPGAVRGTPDQNILLRQSDVPLAVDACLSAGLMQSKYEGRQYIYFDEEQRKRSSTWFLIANQKFRDTDVFPTPDVTDSVRGADYQVIHLLPLVIMKLTANRIIDRIHLCDLLNVDVINADWLDRVPTVLKERLNQVLDDPFG